MALGPWGSGLIITPAPRTPRSGQRGKPGLGCGAGPASAPCPPRRAAAGSGGDTEPRPPAGMGPQEHPKAAAPGLALRQRCQGISRSIPSPPWQWKNTGNKIKWKVRSRLPCGRHSDPNPKPFPSGRAPGRADPTLEWEQSPHGARRGCKAGRRQKKAQTKIPKQNPTRPGANPAEGEAGADEGTEVSQQRREKQSRIQPRSRGFREAPRT